jgi:hypothetical protein
LEIVDKGGEISHKDKIRGEMKYKDKGREINMISFVKGSIKI